MNTKREFILHSDRYRFDFNDCSVKNGYAQVDTSQDASYFGTWANPFTLTIVCYCEGDLTTDTYDTPEEFVAGIQSIKSWNDESGHKFLGIDPGISNPDLRDRFIELGLESLLH